MRLLQGVGFIISLNRNLTILVAEDNEDDALFLKRGFQKIGMTNPVVIVKDGAEVIQYLRAEGEYSDRTKYPFPSVLFLDVKMPDVGGVEVLKWIREHPEHKVIPTIIFSSSDHPKDIERAYELGANAYLVKQSQPRLNDMLRHAYEFWADCAKPPVSM